MMPLNHSSRCHQHQRLQPSRPEPLQENPEQLLDGGQSPVRSLRVQRKQLLAKSETFEDQVLAGHEGTAKPAKEMPEGTNHARILADQSTIATFPVSLSFYDCRTF